MEDVFQAEDILALSNKNGELDLEDDGGEYEIHLLLLHQLLHHHHQQTYLLQPNFNRR